LIAGIPYKHVLVDPANKPEEFKELYASIVGNDFDNAKVPTIVGVSCACNLSPVLSM
jgi:hypothetical protein